MKQHVNIKKIDSNTKWNIEMVAEDLKELKEKFASANLAEKETILKDIRRYVYLLQIPRDFDKGVRASHVYSIADHMETKFGSELTERPHSEILEDAAVKLQNLKRINLIGQQLLNNIINVPKLKNIRDIEKCSEQEIVLLMNARFNEFGMFDNFNNYLKSGKVNISHRDNTDHSFVVLINSLQKTYSNIYFQAHLTSMEDFLYCYFKTKLFEQNANREASIFNKTIENFFNLIDADYIKEKGYKSYYNIKKNVLNDYKLRINEFRYITESSDYLKFDFEKNKFVIDRSTSLYDSEMTDYFKKGVPYKSIMQPITIIYSHLLAIYLYNQYRKDKYKTILDIDYLIQSIGVIPDEEILRHIQANDSESFIQGDYYKGFVEEVSDDYATVKRVNKGDKIWRKVFRR